MKVKVFSNYLLSRKSLDKLEDQVNRWLKDNPEVKVMEIKQSWAGGGLGPGQLLISLWYESAS